MSEGTLLRVVTHAMHQSGKAKSHIIGQGNGSVVKNAVPHPGNIVRRDTASVVISKYLTITGKEFRHEI